MSDNHNHNHNSISFTDIQTILRRRKWWLIVPIIAALIPTLIYNSAAIPIFETSTKVLFGEKEKVIDTNQPGTPTNQNLIANQIEEMETRAFAEEIFAEMEQEAREKIRFLSPFSPELDFENFAVMTIMNNLSFNPVEGTEIVDISFESESPELTKTVAATATKVLINRNLSVKRQQYSSVKKFVEEQFGIVKARLDKAEKALKDFKETQNISSLEDESREILRRMTQAEIVYNQVRSDKQKLQEQLVAIRTKINSEKKDLSKNITNINSPLAINLKKRLVDLEVTYSNLQVQGFPEDNPKMLDLRKEKEQIKQSLVSEALKLNNDESMEGLIDPFSQIRKFLEETISLEVEVQALKAKEENLKVLLKDYRSSLRGLPNKELNLVRLLRDKEANNKLYMTLLEEREKARIQEASEIGGIRILETARFPDKPIRPRKPLNIILAIFAGTFLGVFLVFFSEYFNDEVRTSEDLEKLLRIPVIAAIPKGQKELNDLGKQNGKPAFDTLNGTYFFDAFNSLSFALEKKQKGCPSIMVTSCTPNEGKSTISALLAIFSAQRGRKTLLIDADLRKPSLDSLLHVAREPGLTDLITNLNETVGSIRNDENGTMNGHGSLNLENESTKKLISQVINTALSAELIQPFETNLYFLSSGSIPGNPVQIWSSAIWEQIFAHFNRFFDMVVIDTPPIIGIAETAMIATYAKQILFCVAAEGIDKKIVARSYKMFEDSIADSETKVIGSILNKTALTNVYGYGNYKYYHSQTHKKKNKFTEAISKIVSSKTGV